MVRAATIASPIARTNASNRYSLSCGPGLASGWCCTANTGRPLSRNPATVHEPCPHCGYDTRGLPRDAATGEATCPECGRAVPDRQAQEAAGSGLP